MMCLATTRRICKVPEEAICVNRDGCRCNPPIFEGSRNADCELANPRSQFRVRSHPISCWLSAAYEGD
jgi:hypothetical protein